MLNDGWTGVAKSLWGHQLFLLPVNGLERRTQSSDRREETWMVGETLDQRMCVCVVCNRYSVYEL